MICLIHHRFLHFTVALPHGYNSQDRYDVLYIHDGGKPANLALNYIDHLIRNGDIKPVIIVGIEPINRMNDYTPWKSKPLVDGRPDFIGQADQYLDILTRDIKPFIENKYAVNTGLEHSAIGGASLGGLVSLYASYTKADYFGKYIILSPSLWYEQMDDFLAGKDVTIDHTTIKKNKVDRSQHEIYLYVGALEGIYKKTAQKQMNANLEKTYEIILEEGIPTKQINFVKDDVGTHDQLFFAQYLLEALTWLYGK